MLIISAVCVLCCSHGSAAEAEATVTRERGGQETPSAESTERGEEAHVSLQAFRTHTISLRDDWGLWRFEGDGSLWECSADRKWPTGQKTVSVLCCSGRSVTSQLFYDLFVSRHTPTIFDLFTAFYSAKHWMKTSFSSANTHDVLTKKSQSSS